MVLRPPVEPMLAQGRETLPLLRCLNDTALPLEVRVAAALVRPPSP
ncbi:hypothetical protein PV664_36120 [Streptomyces sp. ME01-18a]|nr:hypothetical protein [Streptomyces sp. ME01-18a]